MLSVGMWNGRVIPDPDGAIDTEAERLHYALLYAFVAATPTPTPTPVPIEPTFGSGPQPHSRRPPWGIVSEGGWRRPDETPEVEPTFDAEALRDARRGLLDVTRAAASMVGAGSVQEVLRATGDLVRPEAHVTGWAHVENEDEWLRLL